MERAKNNPNLSLRGAKRQINLNNIVIPTEVEGFWISINFFVYYLHTRILNIIKKHPIFLKRDAHITILEFFCITVKKETVQHRLKLGIPFLRGL